MRRTLVEAGHHARHRSAFGSRLLDQPLMRNVLADLALESEAATALTLRLAGAADRSVRGDEGERMFRRLATAVGKYWVTKRGPASGARRLVERWRSPCRPPCWSGTPRPRSPTRSARPGSAASGGTPTARSPAPPTWTRSCGEHRRAGEGRLVAPGGREGLRSGREAR
ncbi:oxidoreductase [Streptomyces bottropensis ATCC 25435]|uniref:Oxidoreductase n=1 Tax=Streptomyces bottropensis ATCC 25435 TaxID=1054862 RepID=M3F8S2_9ACTN|nr:oxidoreductase [Streptomyces bottropensis ATCC 25435]